MELTEERVREIVREEIEKDAAQRRLAWREIRLLHSPEFQRPPPLATPTIDPNEKRPHDGQE